MYLLHESRNIAILKGSHFETVVDMFFFGANPITDVESSTCDFRVTGAVLIVMGLYAVLWGKYKENKEKEAEITIEVMKCCSENGRLETVVEDAEVNNDIEMQKGEEALRDLRVAIVVPKV